MKAPNLIKIDNIRKDGFRPGVVACVINNKKVLMFYKNDHRLWQLPQGRIENKENPADALKRNLIHEVGSNLVKHLDFKDIMFIDSDKMEFKPGRHEMETMFDDSGKEIKMMGKEYLFFVINSSENKIDIKKSKFDQYFWLTFREAYFLADRMYQKGKRRITIKILNKLNELDLIE